MFVRKVAPDATQDALLKVDGQPQQRFGGVGGQVRQIDQIDLSGSLEAVDVGLGDSFVRVVGRERQCGDDGEKP